MRRTFIALVACCLVSACSSTIEGTTQEITVGTTPSGANCEFIRQGAIIAQVRATPGKAIIDKNKYDLTIKCSKKGYKTATYLNKSDVAAATVGNAVFGGAIGWAVDSSNGADNKYTSPVHLTLEPLN